MRWRATWSGDGAAIATPGCRGFISNALSRVRAGSWAKAVRPNPAHSMSVANRRIVYRMVIRDSRECARNNRLQCFRQTAGVGLILERKKSGIDKMRGIRQDRLAA